MTCIGMLIPPRLRRSLFTAADLTELGKLGRVVSHDGELPATVKQAIAILREADIAIGSWSTVHAGTPGLLAECPRLGLWMHVAGSVKQFFNEYSAGRKLVVASCKKAIADCVAEMALAEMICGLRRLWPNAKANRGAPSGAPPGIKVLETATVGIIGASEVGKRLLELLRPFGCRVLLYDPYCDSAQAQDLGAHEKVDDLLALCRRSDAITLHTPLLPATRRLLRAEHFQAMADDAIFINTARGGCVDEPALLAELEKGRLYAFLDVTDPEPAAPDSPLRRLPNVVLTSHIAGPATFNMGRQCVADVRAFLAGGQPTSVVTAEMLERIA